MNKPWAKDFPPVSKINAYSRLLDDAIILTNINGGLLPELGDDELRMTESAFPPNTRTWRLEHEEDCVAWFHAEVSNVVLAAWQRYPSVLQQSQPKPFTEQKRSEIVDITYTVNMNGQKIPLVIREMKRNIIRAKDWLGVKVSATQQKLSRELRG